MKILMARNEFGSPDGIHIHRFVEGQTYDADTWPMSRELARSFLQAKVAELVKEQDTPGPTENKDDAGFVAARTKKEEESASEDQTSEATSEEPAVTPVQKRGRPRITVE